MGKLEESKLKHIVGTLQALQFGTVVITVHDGEITQVDTTEKKRFPMLKNRSVKAE